jgi:hypothetical protein
MTNRCTYAIRILPHTLSLRLKRSSAKFESTSLSTDVFRGCYNILMAYVQLMFFRKVILQSLVFRKYRKGIR